MWDVDRSTPQKRIDSFVTRSEGLIYEMHHQERIAKVHFFRLLTSRSGALKTARLCLGCLINVLIISCSLLTLTLTLTLMLTLNLALTLTLTLTLPRCSSSAARS